jgi:hypothetical protein
LFRQRPGVLFEASVYSMSLELEHRGWQQYEHLPIQEDDELMRGAAVRVPCGHLLGANYGATVPVAGSMPGSLAGAVVRIPGMLAEMEGRVGNGGGQLMEMCSREEEIDGRGGEG